jgi:hypothetical protein
MEREVHRIDQLSELSAVLRVLRVDLLPLTLKRPVFSSSHHH